MWPGRICCSFTEEEGKPLGFSDAFSKLYRRAEWEMEQDQLHVGSQCAFAWAGLIIWVDD